VPDALEPSLALIVAMPSLKLPSMSARADFSDIDGARALAEASMIDPCPAFFSKFALSLGRIRIYREAAVLLGFANLLAGMSLTEELHTVGFTIFVVIGSVCCFFGPEKPQRF